MYQFQKFIFSWNSTCFGQFLCPLSGFYSLYTQQWCMPLYLTGLYTAFEQDEDGTSWSCSKAVYKHVWHIPLLNVQWINFWWRTEDLSETCRVSWQNKFVNLVHLFGFITKKFVTMHYHINVKNVCVCIYIYIFFSHIIYVALLLKTQWRTCLTHCAQAGKSWVRFPISPWSWGRLGLLTEMNTKNVSCRYGRPVCRNETLATFMCRLPKNFRSLNLLQS
jgi:hypothetical protein